MVELLKPSEDIITYIYDNIKDGSQFTLCNNIEIDEVDCNIRIAQRHNFVAIYLYLNNIYRNEDYDDISIHCISKIEYTKETIEYLIDKLQEIVKNKDDYMICGTNLILKKDYEMKKRINKMFIFELNKCWICLDECLSSEHLLCGHSIHTKCAEILIISNKKKKIETIKCGCCMKKYYPAFYEICNEEDEEDTNNY